MLWYVKDAKTTLDIRLVLYRALRFSTFKALIWVLCTYLLEYWWGKQWLQMWVLFKSTNSCPLLLSNFFWPHLPDPSPTDLHTSTTVSVQDTGGVPGTSPISFYRSITNPSSSSAFDLLLLLSVGDRKWSVRWSPIKSSVLTDQVCAPFRSFTSKAK